MGDWATSSFPRFANSPSRSLIMATLIRVCRKCGAKIFADAPEGLCTGCVLETALGMLPDASVAAVADCGSAENPQTNNADALSHLKATSRAAKILGKLGDY